MKMPQEVLIFFEKELSRLREIKDQLDSSENLEDHEITELQNEYNNLGSKITQWFLNAYIDTKTQK